MSGRIEKTFAELAKKNRKALVTYLCVGDPTPDETVDLALACVEAGADILELGVPFSDPSADGPAIERASVRAIRGGSGLSVALDVAARVRKRTDVPIVLFGYYNPLFVHGEERVVAEASRAGVDAFLVVDLPLDVDCALRAASRANQIRVIPLVTPTTLPERLDWIRKAREDAGFIYYVSVAGITGSANAPLAEASHNAGQIGSTLSLPAVVGFGIDSPAKAELAAKDASGVVVGTAIVKAIESNSSAPVRKDAVTGLVASLRQALDRVSIPK